MKSGTHEWINVSGVVSECSDLPVKHKLLDECPVLDKHYSSADASHYNVYKMKIVNSEFH